MKSGEPLDRNLRALLQRAYVAARPEPAFRERLRHEVLRRVDALGSRPAPGSASAWRGPVRWIVAAAAVLLVVLGARFFAPGDGTSDASSILAAGRVAVRYEPAASWTELKGDGDRAALAYRAPFVELRTPADLNAALGFDARAAQVGEVFLEPDSSLIARADSGGAVALDLSRGAALFRCSAPTRVATAEGELVVAGTVRLEHVQQASLSEALTMSAGATGLVRVTVTSGEARLATETARQVSLAAGQTGWLGAGRWVRLPDDVPVSSLDAPPTEPQPAERQPVALAPELASPIEVAAPAPELAAPALRGRALSAATGEPLTTFTVTFLREANLPDLPTPRMRRIRSADGRFAVDDLPAGRYTIYVVAEGFAAWKQDGLEFDQDEVVARLVARAGGPVVRGYVFDEVGLPLEGALVLSEADFPSKLLPLALDEARAMEGAPWYELEVNVAHTAPDGSFLLEGLSVGEHVLRASRPGFAPAWSERLQLGVGELPAQVEFRLCAPAAVEGRVFTTDGEPLVGALISATYADYSGANMSLTAGSDFTDADGRYRVEDMPSGFTTIVRIRPEDMRPGRQQADAKPRIAFAMLEGGKTKVVDFEEGQVTRRLHGTVSAKGRTLDGIGIMISRVELLDLDADAQSWAAAVLDASGSYAFAEVTPGSYVVFLSFGMNSSLSYVGQVDVLADRDTRFDLRLERGRVHGRVRAGDTGAVLPRSVVLLLGEEDSERGFSGKTLADDEGAFEFQFLPPGTYRLVGYAPVAGYGNEEFPALTITEQEPEAQHELLLHPGGSLEVRAFDKLGRPVEEAKVRFSDQGAHGFEFLPVQETDGEGALLVEGSMAPGLWTVTVTAPGFQAWTRQVRVLSGERTELRAELEPKVDSDND